VVWVRACSSPPFFLLLPVFPLAVGKRKVAAWGVSVLCLLRELGVWFLVAVKWHVNGEGKPGKCSAKAGACPFGADAPHYGTKREAEAAAEELIARESSGFGGDGVADGGVRDAFAPDSGFVVDAAGRFYRDNGEDVTCVSGADVAQWDGGDNSLVDIIDGGGEYALNADAGGADTVARVNGGIVEGDFSADAMFGVRLDEVTGDAEIGDLNGLTEADGTVRQSRITLVSGDASVSRVGDYSAIGRVTGGDVWRVDGGNVYFVSGGGRVESVLSGGRVGAVESGGVVNWVTGEDASVGVVMGGMGSGEKPGIVRSVAGGGVVEHVGERGIVGDVEDGGTVGEVSGEGSVQRVKSGGRVDAVVKNAIVGDNEGVIGFVGSPTVPSSAADGADEPGAWLATNRYGGVVEQVRGGGRVQKNAGTVEAVSSGGIVERLADGGEVRSLHGRVSFMEGTVSRVESMSGSEGAWAEIGSVSHFATVQRGYRGTPVVGRLGPYSRVHFEDGDAQDVLASIGRVDRGALEAGLIKVTYGFQGESLLPLLREREGLPPAE
jgi:hypothetical protein